MVGILKAIREDPAGFYPEGDEQEFNALFLVNEKYIETKTRIIPVGGDGIRTAVSLPIVPPRITEKGYDFLEQYEKRSLFLFQRWCKAIAGITGVIAAIIAIGIFLASVF